MELPENLRNIMVTYKKDIRSGPYGDTITKEVVTRRGFYSKLFDYISVPPDWQHFNMNGHVVLLPHDWGGDRLKIEEVIDWKYCEDELTLS